MGVKAKIDLCIYMTLYHINVKSLEDMNIHISGGKHQRKLDTSPVCTTKLILYSDQNNDKEYQPTGLVRSCLKPDAQRLHKIYF